ncbi:fimbrial protein [Pseudomonas sp. NY15181]|uniref:fimbrial protein n=1 Tax=Pseudomonas sp. NY15181 TaxID=3400349 RepID=UPI003A898719
MEMRKPGNRNTALKIGPAGYGALTLLLSIWSQQLLASSNCSFTGGGPETFTFPSPISVPRDNTATMTPLSSWVSGAAVTNIYTCTSDSNTKVGIGLKFPSLAQAGSYTEGGLTYKVFNTGLAGVGIVYGYRLYSAGPHCADAGGINGWGPWSASPGVNPYNFAYCYSVESTSSTYGAQLQARLIKTGKIAAGTMPSLTLSYTALYTDGNYSTGVGSTNYLVSSVNFQALGCTADGADVILDVARKADFTAATSVKTKPFQFTLRNCPAGMNSIKYQLDPIGTIINATDGTFQNATGTDMAKGVGLRITNEANTAPIRFGDASYVVSDYSPTSGNSSLPIKMNVSYYRTGTAAQVTAGKVRGTAQLTVFYL